MPSIHKLLPIGYFWKMALGSTAEAHCSLNIFFISAEKYLTFRSIVFSTLGDFILRYYQHWKNSCMLSLCCYQDDLLMWTSLYVSFWRWARLIICIQYKIEKLMGKIWSCLAGVNQHFIFMQWKKFPLKWPKSLCFDIFSLWNKSSPSWISSDMTEDMTWLHCHSSTWGSGFEVPLSYKQTVARSVGENSLHFVVWVFLAQFYFLTRSFPKLG